MNILEARRRTLGGHILKKTAQGNPAIANDSLARMYPGIEMQGWTEQDGTPTPEAPVPIVSAGNYDEASGKYKFDVALGGANLFDISKVNSLNGIANNGDGTITVNTPSGSSAISTNKTLRELCNGISTGTYFLQADTTGQDKHIYIGRVWKFGTSTELTDEDLEEYVLLYASGINTTATISNIMINHGEAPLPWEPYKPPQTVTLTSDRPLTKWDKLEKRNGQWGWVYKSAEAVFDGDTSEAWIQYNTLTDANVFYIDISDTLDKASSMEIFCNKMENVRNGYNVDRPYIICGHNNYGNIYVNVKPTDASKVSGFKTWLSENPLTVLFETSAETFAPLTASEQEQMNALYTYRPTTVLSNQQDCDMTLTYKSRKGMS